jgi:hypothetical protein
VESPEKLQVAYEALKKLLGHQPGWIEHLDYDQLAGYVDGKLESDRAAEVEAHTAQCVECKDEIEGLKELKAELAADLTEGERPPKRRLRRLSRWSARGRGLSAGLIVLVVATGVAFWWYARDSRVRLHSLEMTVSQLRTENDELKRPAGNSAVLREGTRQVYVATNGAVLGLDGLGPDIQALVREALTTGRVSVSAEPRTTVGRLGVLAGSGTGEESFDVLFPSGTAVEETRPRFEWRPLIGASGYTVLLKDLATGVEIEGKSTTETFWIPENPLVHGHQYVWMVEAATHERYVRAPAPDKPFATFRILSIQESEEVRLARTSWSDSHLVLGLTYAKVGLLGEAEREFRDLVAGNPESSAVKKLLETVEARKTSGGQR